MMDLRCSSRSDGSIRPATRPLLEFPIRVWLSDSIELSLLSKNIRDGIKLKIK